MHAQTHSNSSSRNMARAKFKWLRQVCADPNLNHLPCRIAALLLDHINVVTGEAWPSQARLAAAAGVTTRAVQNALKRLSSAGHLEVRRAQGRANRYRPTLMANARSAEGWESWNVGSETSERGFSRLQETPLEEARPIPTGEEWQRLAAEMQALARRLGSATPAAGGARD